MKNILFIVVFTLLLGCLEAQDIFYGVRAGGNAAHFETSDDGWSKSKFGYYIGGVVGYGVSESVKFTLEPSYVLRGANEFNVLNVYSEKSTKLYDFLNNKPIEFEQHNISMHCAEVPLLVHYSFGLGGLKFRAYAGPSIDFIVKAYHFAYKKDEEIGGVLLNDINNRSDVTDRFKSFEMSAIVGAAIDFELMGRSMFVDFRYRQGMANINNVADKESIRSNGFSVGLGVNIGNI